MRTIIIEDDKVFLYVLQELCSKNDHIELVNVFTNAQDALDFLQHESVDLVLLDIGLPDVTGMEILKNADKKTQVIIITGDSKYAVDAFDFKAVDYLLKPVSNERFNTAIAKANENFNLRFSNLLMKENLFIKESGAYHHVKANDVLYVEAFGDYVSIVAKDKKFTILSTMREIEQKLPEHVFIRVHRSYIANIDKIETYDGSMVTVDKKVLSVGKTYKKIINSRLNIL